MTRRTRLNFLVDFVAGILFILSLFAGDGSLFHVVVAFAFTAVVVAHLALHWRWFTRQVRYLRPGPKRQTSRTTMERFAVDMFILVTFWATALSGVALIAAADNVAAARMHGLSSALFILGTVVHIVQHRSWILSCIRRAGGARGSRSGQAARKGVAAASCGCSQTGGKTQ